MDNYPVRSSIKFWSEGDRPREKLLLKGKASLSDSELIAILLGSGTRNESAVDLSKRILNSVSNNLVELSRLTVSDLQKFKGIGLAKAINLVAAMELGRRRRGAEALERKTIRSSQDAYELLQMYLADSNYEQFIALYLNRGNQVIRTVNISEGGMVGTVADPKKIYKLALESSACGIIFGHNHPSGNIQPSDTDVKLTRRLKDAGRLLEIDVLDHLIIGNERYFSFADEGMMN